MIQASTAVIVIAVSAIGIVSRSGVDTDELLERTRIAAAERGTYKMLMTQRFKGSGAGAFSIRMEGFGDTERELGRVLVISKGTGFNVACTIISSKDAVFTKVHTDRLAEFGGKAWAQTDIDEMTGPGSMLGQGTFDFRPDKLAKTQDRAFNDLEEAGRATIRGVSTTRYTGTYNIAAFLADDPPSPLPTQGFSQPKVEMFIDDDGLLRRMVTTITVDPTGGQSVGLTTTMDFFDYGKPVDLKAPPPSDVKAVSGEQAGTACLPKTPVNFGESGNRVSGSETIPAY